MKTLSTRSVGTMPLNRTAKYISYVISFSFTHTHTHTNARARAHTHTHTHTRTRTHSQLETPPGKSCIHYDDDDGELYTARRGRDGVISRPPMAEIAPTISSGEPERRVKSINQHKINNRK